MDEARAVLARLERIEELDRQGGRAQDLLAELRALLGEAEAWTRAEHSGTEVAEEALERLRMALGKPSANALGRAGLW